MRRALVMVGWMVAGGGCGVREDGDGVQAL